MSLISVFLSMPPPIPYGKTPIVLLKPLQLEIVWEVGRRGVLEDGGRSILPFKTVYTLAHVFFPLVD